MCSVGVGVVLCYFTNDFIVQRGRNIENLVMHSVLSFIGKVDVSLTEGQFQQSIKQILGLQHGKQYDSVKTLRYGHLMIMTDQILCWRHCGIYYHVFSAFGFVHKIATFEKAAGFQALIQFSDAETAAAARDALDGRSIPRYLLPDHVAGGSGDKKAKTSEVAREASLDPLAQKLQQQRQALILARLVGQRIDLDNIKVESLYPEEMGPNIMHVEDFLVNGLPLLDKGIQERVEN
ncbi:unnamed protein product [Camellia sinensis]